MKRPGERAFEGVVTAAGWTSAAIVVLILVFLGKQSLALFLPTPGEGDEPGEPGYSLVAFLTGMRWIPNSDKFGFVPLGLGSLLVSVGALAIAVPLGLGTATFLSEFAPRWLREVLKPAVELLAAIPSIVIGAVGLTLLAPVLMDVLGLKNGLTAATGSIALAVMALPTIVTIAEDALAAVPRSYRDASLALGANRWQTTWRVVLPAAAPSLLAAVILGAGRVLGETMAVLLVTGNADNVTWNPLRSVRTITATIAAETGEAPHGSSHRHALFALGAILYLVTLAINGSAIAVLERSRRKLGGAR